MKRLGIQLFMRINYPTFRNKNNLTGGEIKSILKLKTYSFDLTKQRNLV